MSGTVTRWNDAVGAGLIDAGENGTFSFRRRSCSQRLQTALSQQGPPLTVTFDVSPLSGQAVNVDLAASEDLAAAEPAMNLRQ